MHVRRDILSHTFLAPQVRVDVDELGVDLLTVVGHKFGAAKGVAALYIRSGVRLARFLHGGGQARFSSFSSSFSFLLCIKCVSDAPSHPRFQAKHSNVKTASQRFSKEARHQCLSNAGPPDSPA